MRCTLCGLPLEQNHKRGESDPTRHRACDWLSSTPETAKAAARKLFGRGSARA